MLDIIVILTASLVALVGAAMNTEVERHGKKVHAFKRPTAAGWTIITAIILLCVLQLAIKHSDASKHRLERAADSARSSAPLSKALAHSRQLADEKTLLGIAYDSQIKTLTNTTSLIGRAKDLQEGMSREFSSTANRFQALLAQSTSLMRPVLPMMVRFRIVIPFTNSLLADWVKRTTPLRDSLIANPMAWSERSGTGTMGFDPNVEASGRTALGTVRYVNIDSSSDLYIRPTLDGYAATLLNPRFELQVFPSPPSADRNHPAPLLALDANELTEPAGANGLSRKTMEINLRDSTVVLNLFYKATALATRSSIVGVNDLADKYLLISGRVANTDYKLESLVLFTGPFLTQATLLQLGPEHDVSRRDGINALEYLRRIDAADLR